MYTKIIVGVISIGIVGVAYYGLSPLFTHIRVDEAPPVAKESSQPRPTPVTSEVETTQTREVKEKEVAETAASTDTEKPLERIPAPIPVIDKTTQETASAAVIGTSGHPGSGTARVIVAESGTVVRYENFKTINGPDLFVYLAKDLGAKEFVSLGELRATEGNINYEVPQGVNVQEYKYVMVWCKQFGVLFNYAELR